MFSSRNKVLAAACLVMAGGFAFYFWQSSNLKRLSVEPQRIAVLPFENQTTDATLDPLRAALAVALADRLAAMDRTDAFAAGGVGEAAGRQATVLVHGRIEEDRGAFRLVASVERLSSREFEGAGSASGARESIVKLLDTIGEGVRSAVRPKGKLAPAELNTLASAIALGRSLEAGATDAASDALRQAVQDEPDCGVCWRRLVELSLTAGAKEKAFEFAEASRGKAISAYSRAWIDLAVAGAREDREGQRAALERLTRLRPGDFEFQARLGATLAALGRWPEAVASYRQAVASSPFSAGLWNEFGYTLGWAGMTEEANRALNEYARLDPASANPLDSQGEVALMNGRFAEAIQRFEESYRKDAKFNGGQAIEKAGYTAYLAGEKARAASYVDRYLGGLGNTPKPAALLIRARWQMAFGQVSGAVELLDQLDPAAAALAAAIGGDWEDAGRRLKAKPNAGAPGFRLVVAGDGKFPAAAAELPHLAQARGLSAALRGRWSEATVEFSRALRRLPANSTQASLLKEAAAFTLVMENKPAEAAKTLGAHWPLPMATEFSELELFVYPNLFYTRAEIARAQSRKDEATRQYDQFLQYVGGRKDVFGTIARARAASRL